MATSLLLLAAAAAGGALTPEVLDRMAAEDPARALAEAEKIPNAAVRDRVERRAFLGAAARDRKQALRFAAQFAARPWLGEIAFGDAVALAERAEPWLGKRLLLASAAKHPSVALRSRYDYERFGFAQTVFDEAARWAPDEAASLPSIATDLAKSPELAVRWLARLATAEGLTAQERSRMGILAPELARGTITFVQARRAAADSRQHFAQVVDYRLRVAGTEAAVLDRYLAVIALALCREERPAELRRWGARDLVVLLGYARPEDDETFFPDIFDAALAPQLRERPLAALMESAGWLQTRRLLSTALAESRFERLLAAGRDDADRAAVLLGCLRGIDGLEEALFAAEIVDTPAARARAADVRRRVEQEGSGAAGPYYRVLAKVMATATGGREVREFDSAALFDAAGVCRQRHYFYNDRDGVETWESFRASLRDWAVEDRGGWIVATRASGARRLKIFANAPIDLLDPVNGSLEGEARRRGRAVAEALRLEGAEPAVIVHRGHAYHVENTVAELTRANRLVVLGSCRGLRDIPKVVEAAPEANVIATRGIGTAAVNEPLLGTLQDYVLGGKPFTWRDMWASFQARAGGRSYFSGYIAPDRNPVTVYLRAYYAYIENQN